MMKLTMERSPSREAGFDGGDGARFLLTSSLYGYITLGIFYRLFIFITTQVVSPGVQSLILVLIVLIPMAQAH